MWAALSPLVLWLAAIAAYAYEDAMNLFQWMGRFSQVLERPFAIGWTPYTLKYMLVGLLLYGCGIALYYSSRENRRPGEEYGSAKWGSPKELNRKYMDHQHKDANIILTQRVRLGMDGYITQRNMNVLVVGGSGSGKTRFFCKPNIYSANCSYLIRMWLLRYTLDWKMSPLILLLAVMATRIVAERPMSGVVIA